MLEYLRDWPVTVNWHWFSSPTTDVMTHQKSDRLATCTVSKSLVWLLWSKLQPYTLEADTSPARWLTANMPAEHAAITGLLTKNASSVRCTTTEQQLLTCMSLTSLLVWASSLPSSAFPPPHGLVVKASASRAEGLGFESRLRWDFFGVESYQWLKNWHSSGYPARRLAL